MVSVNQSCRSVILTDLGKNVKLLTVFMEEAKRMGWEFQSSNHYNDTLPEGFVPQGALVTHTTDRVLVERLKELRIPTVRIADDVPVDDELHTVCLDRSSAGTAAADYFSTRGFRTLAFVGLTPWGGWQDLIRDVQGASPGAELCVPPSSA